MNATLMIAALMLAAPVKGTTDADWPQWRGHGRDGKSLETGLLKDWKGGSKLAWTNSKIGLGYGSPIVVGDKVYILGGSENAAGSPEFVRCLNLKDGQEVWYKPLGTTPGKYLDKWGGGPRSTPTFANGKLYCLGSTGDLACLDAKDGKEIWKKNLVSDFGGGVPTWGYSESVLIDGENLICTPGKSSCIVALNAETGNTVWKCTELKDDAGYSSILPVNIGSVRVYLQQTMGSSLGVRAKDGKVMFKNAELARRTAVIPSPVFADNHVFFTAGYGAGCECYKLSADGDSVKAEKVFSKFKSLGNHHGGVIQIGDHVYGHSDNGGWTCLAYKQADDKAVWANSKFPKGSISFADGHFFCYEERGGSCAVVKATDKGWEEVGMVKIPAKSPTNRGMGAIWGHPVVAHGKLFLRDFDTLHVFELKK